MRNNQREHDRKIISNPTKGKNLGTLVTFLIYLQYQSYFLF